MSVVWALYCVPLLLMAGDCVPQHGIRRCSLLDQCQDPGPDDPATEARRRINCVPDSAPAVEQAMEALSEREVLSEFTTEPSDPKGVSCLGRGQDHIKLLEDVLATFREGQDRESELTKKDFVRLGVCSDVIPASAFLELAGLANKQDTHDLHAWKANKEIRIDDDDDRKLVLTLHLPKLPLLGRQPLLFLAFESPLRTGNLVITFTSPSIQPNRQTLCISEGTQYLIVNGLTSEENSNKKLQFLVETTPDTEDPGKHVLMLNEILSNVSMTPLVLLSVDKGTVGPQQSRPSRTYSFLCELQIFLEDILPQSPPSFTPVQLRSLNSLPPLSLGLSSGETLLAGLLNSSAPTYFSFPRDSTVLKGHRGELSLSPALLELLKLRLEEAVTQMSAEEVGQRAQERLKWLKGLCSLSEEGKDLLKETGSPGEIQYRALLLLKALQTVLRAWEVERGQRATRADQEGPGRSQICRLHSLTVSLKDYLMAPPTANINNCQGLCGFPLFNTNNHAVLLNSQIKNGLTLERPLCCVPVEYEDLQVAQLDAEGTALSIKPDMVAKDCGCR